MAAGDRLLGEKGIQNDSHAGRQEFALLTEKRRAEETGADYKQIRKGWFLGSEQFRQELLATATERVGRNNYGIERHETDVHKAERIVKRFLAVPDDGEGFEFSAIFQGFLEEENVGFVILSQEHV